MAQTLRRRYVMGIKRSAPTLLLEKRSHKTDTGENEMTTQEIFDKCSSHLLKQNFKCTFDMTNMSKRPGLYKRHDGAACPIGILIPKEEYRHYQVMGRILPYDLTLEYKPVKQICVDENNGLSESTKKLLFDNIAILTEIQYVHDNIPVNMWKEKLSTIASKYKLSFNS